MIFSGRRIEYPSFSQSFQSHSETDFICKKSEISLPPKIKSFKVHGKPKATFLRLKWGQFSLFVIKTNFDSSRLKVLFLAPLTALDSNSNVEAYEVQILDENSSQVAQKTYKEGLTECEINNLRPSQQYFIKVRDIKYIQIIFLKASITNPRNQLEHV